MNMKRNFPREMASFMSIFLLGHAATASVPVVPNRIEGRQVIREAKKLILNKWKADGIDVQIESLKDLEDLFVPSNDVQWEIQWTDRKPFSGLLSLPLLITQDGQVIKRSSVILKTRIFRTVAVSSATIDRHEALKISDFSLVKAELTSDIDQYVTDLSFLESKRATRRLNASTPVLKNYVETKPLVSRGDRVSLVNKNGPIEISARGVARADGCMGDEIQVMNLHSGKLMTATVRTESRLEISNMDLLR